MRDPKRSQRLADLHEIRLLPYSKERLTIIHLCQHPHEEQIEITCQHLGHLSQLLIGFTSQVEVTTTASSAAEQRAAQASGISRNDSIVYALTGMLSITMVFVYKAIDVPDIGYEYVLGQVEADRKEAERPPLTIYGRLGT